MLHKKNFTIKSFDTHRIVVGTKTQERILRVAKGIYNSNMTFVIEDYLICFEVARGHSELFKHFDCFDDGEEDVPNFLLGELFPYSPSGIDLILDSDIVLFEIKLS